MFTFEELWASRRPDLVRKQREECTAEWFTIKGTKKYKKPKLGKKTKRRRRKRR
ncbi:MAG: hypothetical protein GY832_20180 [Chloroflexi bacterium]|nr:hypothetical protein [Chloroflexota bacterium]